MAQTLEEEVNTPKHYRTHESGLEAIEITRWLIGDLSNAWKYAMRYEDKNTPKKDVMKLCWYLNDFHKHFINMNNEVTNTTLNDLPSYVISDMLKVIDNEPVPQIKEVFKQILTLYECKGILIPSEWNKMLDDLVSYANTLN